MTEREQEIRARLDRLNEATTDEESRAAHDDARANALLDVAYLIGVLDYMRRQVRS